MKHLIKKRYASLLIVVLLLFGIITALTGCMNEDSTNDVYQSDIKVKDATSEFYVNDYGNILSSEQRPELVKRAKALNEEYSTSSGYFFIFRETIYPNPKIKPTHKTMQIIRTTFFIFLHLLFSFLFYKMPDNISYTYNKTYRFKHYFHYLCTYIYSIGYSNARVR